METYNYSQFKFNDKNRSISNKNVTDIKNSITQVGFIKQRAILVNKDNIIIDGHHRFLALKELNMPIIYEVEREISQKEMILLNSCQRTWTLEDFIRLYAKDNILVYSEIISLPSDTHVIGKRATGLFSFVNITASLPRQSCDIHASVAINEGLVDEDTLKGLLGEIYNTILFFFIYH